MNILTIMTGLLFILGLLSLLRVLIGKNIWDKILGFNLFSSNFILIILIFAATSELNYLIDIAMVYALLGFVSIVFITRFIQRKGAI